MNAKLYTRVFRKIHLIYLQLLRIFFQFRKRVKGVDSPIIHYYSVCWNEEKIIPFLFKHYDEIVDHYYIWDNGSTDHTLELLKNNPKITIYTVDTENQFNVLSNMQIKEHSWKKSRGKADWVIVADMDEFLFCEKPLKEILRNTDKTIFKPEGYEMISETYPNPDKPIIEQVKRGRRFVNYDKLILFNPYKILDINWGIGFHTADPVGSVWYSNNEVKLLHYKRLGIDYMLARKHDLNNRYSHENRKKGMGIHYTFADEDVKREFQRDLLLCNQIIE